MNDIKDSHLVAKREADCTEGGEAGCGNREGRDLTRDKAGQSTKFAKIRLIQAYTRHFTAMTSLHSIRVIPVQQLDDNYAYILTDGKSTAFIDAVEPEKVVSAAKQHQIPLETVTTLLTTHHHLDHAGGNVKAKIILPKVEIVGGDARIPAISKTVAHGDSFTVGDMKVTALHTPCHTTGHICYRVQSNASDAGHVFTGDTLFVGGCGKFFEGTAREMHKNLAETLGKLPKDTKVWVGHEYTRSNLAFCQHIEPDNVAIQHEVEKCTPGRISVPSTIGQEWEWNVFMRVCDPNTGILSRLQLIDPVEGLARYVTN